MKTQRICERGHKYYKSSDCPVCPICANEDKPVSFLGQLSAPARRALIREGITTIELLANYSEEELINLHGIGRNALDTLRIEMNKSKITYKSK